jgi:uncharacterized membrane protein YtjA (UPF0391 family)
MKLQGWYFGQPAVVAFFGGCLALIGGFVFPGVMGFDGIAGNVVAVGGVVFVAALIFLFVRVWAVYRNGRAEGEQCRYCTGPVDSWVGRCGSCGKSSA